MPIPVLQPLLNYDLICKVCEYVKQQGYDATFQMQTNGTLIDEEKAKGIKAMKIAMGVSLDGPPDINEWLRGGTKKAVYGIQCLAQAGVKININRANKGRFLSCLIFSVILSVTHLSCQQSPYLFKANDQFSCIVTF
ncbi:MAG: hypothetical protein JM58_11215 [Peptococcaceae bacterium BICA1-8]|nr:MAG: hypothetical protein JM58_11215 [Peptococcaceae bacterium BICA1-8]